MPPTSGLPALSVRGLRKAYSDVVAVDGIDLEVRPGECFGLLGPNGAGKTTTIEICEGLTRPDAGEVVILGRRWGRDDRPLRELLGISLQETQFSEKLTVTEAVRLCDRVAIMDHGRIIALGTPRELIASLGAEHVLEFAVADGTRLDAAALAGAIGVDTPSRQDGTWRLQVSELHQAMPALLG